MKARRLLSAVALATFLPSLPAAWAQDDIQVKPRGGRLAGGYWTCAADPCRPGEEKVLRDDLFEALSYLDVAQKKLDGVKLILDGENGDVVISVERDGTFFVWTVDGLPLKAAGYSVCKHDNPDKSCKESGIPGSWMDRLKKVSVRYECTTDYKDLTENENVHMKGRPTGK